MKNERQHGFFGWRGFWNKEAAQTDEKVDLTIDWLNIMTGQREELTLRNFVRIKDGIYGSLDPDLRAAADHWAEEMGIEDIADSRNCVEFLTLYFKNKTKESLN